MRKKRVNRFSYRKRPAVPEPRFQAGDQCGEFNVLAYRKYTAVHPTKFTTLSQEHHWYDVRCSCGTVEIHSQQQLIDARRHRMCAKCLAALATLEETV